MILNAKHVAQWWKRRVHYKQSVLFAATQWTESGQPQESSSMVQDFIQRITNDAIN